MQALHRFNASVVSRLGLFWGLALAIVELILAGEDAIGNHAVIFAFLFLAIVAALFLMGDTKDMSECKADAWIYFCLLLFLMGVFAFLAAYICKSGSIAICIPLAFLLYSIINAVLYYSKREEYLLMRNPELEEVFEAISKKPREDMLDAKRADAVIQSIKTYGWDERRMAELLAIAEKARDAQPFLFLADYSKERDEKAYRYWLQKAAESGDVKAALDCASMMEQSDADKSKAYKYYAIAFRGGSLKACDSLGILQTEGGESLKDVLIMCGIFLGMIGAIVLLYAFFAGNLYRSLKEEYPVIGTITIALFIIGFNVINYFASYRWGMRKKWYFWVCLILTLVLISTPLWGPIWAPDRF